MKRFGFFLAVSLCLLVAISQNSIVAAKDSWVSVRTKNFFLLGNANEKDIRKVGLRLEQFRQVFTQLFPSVRFNTPVPTTVVVFKSDGSYAPFKPYANVAGHFQAGPDVNYIALTTESHRDDPFSIIFHEYTHLLINNSFEGAPLWFDEGLAEYYSTFKITDDQKVMLGNPISGHVLLLRENKMLPLQTLFDVDHKSPHYNEKQKQGIFYAESWALMHYLIIGKTGKADQLSKFLELFRSKMAIEDAFQQAFETPYDVMEKDLRNYVKKDRYNVLNVHFKTKIEMDTTTDATPLSEAEVQAYLGDLLLHSRRAEAYGYLEKALKLDPNLAMAHASLGVAYFRDGKIKEALASLERAVATNSQNYLAHYYYAFTLSRASEGEGISVSTYSPEVLAKIKDHLRKAISLRPDFPESYKLLAYMSVVTGEDLDQSIASMKRLLEVTPGRHDFAFMLAQLYATKGEYKTAQELLERVVKSNAEQEVRERSERMLQQLNKYQQERARFEAAQKKTRPGGATGTVVVTSESEVEPSKPQDPSSYLREVLRAPAEGETQLLATLIKIECEAKGIVFVVQTAKGLLRLRTATFDEIEITTYDPKVNGDITCGPKKLQNSVVVCYVAKPDKRARLDGVLKSIEFVPADFKLEP